MSTDDSICESSLPPNKSSGDIVECHKRFNAWFVASYADADGKFRHLPDWLKSDMRRAWDAASSESAAEIERLRRELEAANSNHRSMAHLLAETGIRLEATKREVASLQRALLFWMPGVDLRLDEATRERAAHDAGLLAGYAGPTDGPCWGDGMLDRALSAESALAGAMEYLDREIRITNEQSEQARQQGRRQDMFRFNTAFHALSKAASAIRAAGAEKTAESGHSTSTRERD